MKKDLLDMLKAINSQLHGGRWTDEDLAQLATSRGSVVSGFESMTRELAAILAQDLGDTPPAAPLDEKSSIAGRLEKSPLEAAK